MKSGLIGCLLALIIIAAFAVFEGWIFMLLWNWLVPMFWTTAPIFTLWQSIGILFIINLIGRLLFGNRN